jgi:hypothetical protein
MCEVYMQPLPGYSVLEGMVCRLCHSLYGPKYPRRAWFQHFASMVIAASLSTSNHDLALFIHTSHGQTLLYVDDMIIIRVLCGWPPRKGRWLPHLPPPLPTLHPPPASRQRSA